MNNRYKLPEDLHEDSTVDYMEGKQNSEFFDQDEIISAVTPLPRVLLHTKALAPRDAHASPKAPASSPVFDSVPTSSTESLPEELPSTGLTPPQPSFISSPTGDCMLSELKYSRYWKPIDLSLVYASDGKNVVSLLSWHHITGPIYSKRNYQRLDF